MHSIAFSKCIFPGIFVAVFCSPSSNFNLKEKHQLSTRYFSFKLIFTYQVDFHFICTILRCPKNFLNDTFGVRTSFLEFVVFSVITEFSNFNLNALYLRLFTSISLVWDARIILRMIPLGTLLSRSSKTPSTLDAETQRGPEFLHVKSQCYLQKSPLFNPWHLVFGCFLIEKYTNSEK